MKPDRFAPVFPSLFHLPFLTLLLCSFITVSKIMIPRSLYVVIAILTAGFVASMARTKSAKSKESKYQKLSNAGNDDGGGVQYTAANASYQNTTVSNYAMPPQQKVNTYCVIDSRLVDP